MPWAIAGGAAAAASLLNPLGINLYRFTLNASQLTVNRQFVHEWMPPDFRMDNAPKLIAARGGDVWRDLHNTRQSLEAALKMQPS